MVRDEMVRGEMVRGEDDSERPALTRRHHGISADPSELISGLSDRSRPAGNANEPLYQTSALMRKRALGQARPAMRIL